MGKNTGEGYRQAPTKNRTQAYNPKTGQYMKRDEAGHFMACKDTPFKNVRREESAKVESAKAAAPKSKKIN